MTTADQAPLEARSPPFLIVTAVAVLYTQYQGLAWVQDVFFGVGPAVLAIVASPR